MSDFGQVRGFEDRWRSGLVRPRPDRSVLSAKAWARLDRLAAHAPEAVVRVTAGFRGPRTLARHLDYISRKGELELQGPDGRIVAGREAVRKTAEDWSWTARTESWASPHSPIARSMVLSIPNGPDPRWVEAAAKTFAEQTFAERFEYVYVRHEDGAHPHVHLTVCALGREGERLTPRRQDLSLWRERFAEALRANGIEAEATARRLRGVTRPAERAAVFRIRQRHERGEGPRARVEEALEQEARAFGMIDPARPGSLESLLRRRHSTVREVYGEVIVELRGSSDPADRDLGARLTKFVAEMPWPVTHREALSQQMQAEALLAKIRREREHGSGRERSR